MKRAPVTREDVFRKWPVSADNNDVFYKLAEQFYFSCKVKNLTEKTLFVYGERLSDFQKFLLRSKILFEQVDKTVIQRYILDMKDRVSDHTINGRIRVLKTFFKFLVAEELWKNGNGRPNPTEGIQYLRTEKKFKPVLSLEQIEKLLRVPNRKTLTGYRNFCIIYSLWDSLIRLSELINLRLSDVDFKQGSLRVMGKGRKERILPLGAKLLRHLHAYLANFRSELPGDYFFCTRQGMPLQKRNVGHILDRLASHVNLHANPHLIRHSSASHLALSGIPAFMLQRMLGHTSLNTTKMYIHLIDDQKLREVFQRYSPGDSLRM